MLDSSGVEGPQKKSAQKSIGGKMEGLVFKRPVRGNIRGRAGRLDENQEAVDDNREPVNGEFV